MGAAASVDSPTTIEEPELLALRAVVRHYKSVRDLPAGEAVTALKDEWQKVLQ